MAFGDNAAPKHYKAGFLALNTITTVAPATPANRVLIISKITVVCATACTVTLWAGGTSDSERILHNLSMAVGEVYTETGILLVAGELLSAFSTAAGAISVNVFGEEVDAS